MNMKIKACLFIAAVTASSFAFADAAEDTQWIAKCMLDNKNEGQSTEVVEKYCACMNDKMSSSETQSITQWEKAHPQEEKACSTQAGWK